MVEGGGRGWRRRWMVEGHLRSELEGVGPVHGGEGVHLAVGDAALGRRG